MCRRSIDEDLFNADNKEDKETDERKENTRPKGTSEQKPRFPHLPKNPPALRATSLMNGGYNLAPFCKGGNGRGIFQCHSETLIAAVDGICYGSEFFTINFKISLRMFAKRTFFRCRLCNCMISAFPANPCLLVFFFEY